MHLLKLLGYIFVLLLISCSNNADVQAEEKDTANTQQSPDTSPNTAFKNALSSFYIYLETGDTSFNPEDFEQVGQNVLDTTTQSTLSEKQKEDFFNCFIFNSDSSLALDLFSYNYMVRPADDKLVPLGPDNEIGLVDVNTGKRIRIFFSGPAALVADGSWLNNNTFVLAGAELIDENRIKPFNWKVDLAVNSIEVHHYLNTLNVSLRNYQNPKCSLFKR